jgi:hypothetical protein
MSRRLAAVAALTLAGALGACGGGDKQASTQAETRTQPSGPGRGSITAAALEYCVEGAGAQGEKVDDSGDVEGARRELVVSWPDTGHSADVYFAPDEAAAAEAARKLDAGLHARQDRNAIVVPSSDRAPDSLEALLIDDCIP